MRSRTWPVSPNPLLLAVVPLIAAVAPSAHAKKVTDPFEGCIRAPIEFDFLDALEALAPRTAAEFDEQLRDFVLYGIANDPEDGLTDADIAAIFETRGLLRDAHAEGLLFESGPARSFIESMPAGERLNLIVPIDDAPTEQVQYYVEVLSQTGVVPDEVRLFGYRIERAEARGRACLLASGKPSLLFPDADGIESVTIETASDLDRLLSSRLDPRSASCEDGRLVVTGIAKGGAEIHADHLAVLYQPRPEALAAWDRDVEVLVDELLALTAEHPARREIERRGGLYPKLEPRQVARWVVFDLMIGLGSTDEQLATARVRLHDPGWEFAPSWGFSLDPWLPVDRVLEVIDRYSTPARVLELRARYCKRFGEGGWCSWGDAEGVEKLLAAVRAMIVEEGSILPLQLMMRLPAMEGIAREIEIEAARQCPRFDGPLRGTEVGMTFFHTDLSMKLYMFDYQGIGRAVGLPGFVPVVDTVLTEAECSEPHRVGGRAWLEPRSGAATISPDGERLRLAPVVTRVSARSSEPGATTEADPRPGDRRFMEWWTTRYAEVAAVDPEFAKLDALMKWTLLLAWLSDHPDCYRSLAFLDERSPRRDWTYEAWVEAHRDTLYRTAHPPVVSVPGIAESCFDLVHSRPYSQCDSRRFIYGGVSAASRKVIEGARQIQPVTRSTPGRLTQLAYTNSAGETATRSISHLGGGTKAISDSGPLGVQRLTTVKFDGRRARIGIEEPTPQTQRLLEWIGEHRNGQALSTSLKKADVEKVIGKGRDRAIAHLDDGAVIEIQVGGKASTHASGVYVPPGGKSPPIYYRKITPSPAARHAETWSSGNARLIGRGGEGADAIRGPPAKAAQDAMRAFRAQGDAVVAALKISKVGGPDLAEMQLLKAASQAIRGEGRQGRLLFDGIDHTQISREVAEVVSGRLTREAVHAERAGARALDSRYMAEVLHDTLRPPLTTGGHGAALGTSRTALTAGPLGGQGGSLARGGPVYEVARPGHFASTEIDAGLIHKTRLTGKLPAFEVRPAHIGRAALGEGKRPLSLLPRPSRHTTPQPVFGGVSGEPLRGSGAVAVPIAWTTYVLGRFGTQPPRAAIYGCDLDGNAEVTQTEWLVCRCDADLDGRIGFFDTAEQACVQASLAMLVDGVLPIEQRLIDACDEEGDRALTRATEKSCAAEHAH